MKKHLIGTVQKKLAASRLGTRLAIKLREQCNSIIGLRCKSGIEAELNGEAWLADRVAPDTNIFVDVGANRGPWTTMFASRMIGPARAILFEPNPEAADLLDKIAMPDFTVEIRRKAVGDVAGTAAFFAEPAIGETSSLVATHSAPQRRQIDVCVTTLDEEMVELGVQSIDMLKIDAEGYDFRVLLGARKLLSTQSVGVIQFEYNAPWKAAGSTLTHAFQYLEDMGYAVFLLKSCGLHLLDPYQTGEYFRYSNFVALSPDRADALLSGSAPVTIL